MHALIIWLSGLAWDIAGWTAITAGAEVLAILTLPSILMQRRGQPLAALSWVLALVALPFVGVIAWWLFGRSHLERKRRRRATSRWEIAKGFASLRPEALSQLPGESSPFHYFGRMRVPAADAPGIFPPAPGNRVELLLDGERAYAAIETMLREARHHVHLLFYAWAPDETGRRFRDLLVEKAASGVAVRVLLDAMGSFSMRSSFMRPLVEAGGKVAYFMPARFFRRSLSLNFRNHRKIVVADGRAAYIGGLNIGDAYLRGWRDMGLRLQGPVVANLQEVFGEDWFFATRESLAEPLYLPRDAGRESGGASCVIVPGGPDTPHNTTHDAFFAAITNARKRIWITTPYLIPDTAIQAAMRTAVFRGVDVRLLVPRRSDVPISRLAARSYYPDLLAAGVRIFEYLPAILHAKAWLFDDDLSALGSANLDTRSFKLNFEVSCFIHSVELNAELAGIFEEELLHSEPVTAKGLERTSALRRLAEATMNLLSPML